MGDRVAIIGGSVVGVDHFPFPTTGSGFPQNLGIGTQCILFYIIKQWTIDVDSLPDGETDPGPFILDAANPDDSSLLTRESDLVKAYSWQSGYWNYGGASAKHLTIEFGLDGTVRFTLQLYESQGEVVSMGDWNDSIIFSGDPDYFYIATPTEFWPYADSNGDPVYDTTTGAQLTDPFG